MQGINVKHDKDLVLIVFEQKEVRQLIMDLEVAVTYYKFNQVDKEDRIADLENAIDTLYKLAYPMM